MPTRVCTRDGGTWGRDMGMAEWSTSRQIQSTLGHGRLMSGADMEYLIMEPSELLNEVV